MLSYHGNDHYNSVRSTHAFPPSSGKMIDGLIGGEGQCRSSKKSSPLSSVEGGGGDGDGGAADDANDDNARGADDGGVGAKDSQSTKGGGDVRRIVGNEGKRRPPARGSVCPCGSGKKYKRCCSARDKIEARRTARLLSDGIAPEGYGSARKSDCEKEKDGDEGFIGCFKVLAI
jgi:hypothetical protein